MDYTESSMSQILNGKVPLSEKFIKKLSIMDDDINENWLLTGVGEMLKVPNVTNMDNQSIIDSDVIYVPLLPLSAQGGNLNDFVVSVKDSECEKIISPVKGADWAMTVAGDSMSPEYPSGSQILIKKINEKAFIDWGKVYVLDTCNGSVIKRVFPTDDKDPNKLKCVSINPEYPSFDVSLDDVFGIYRVLLCMSIK
jgi:phage repressor protein C with HTH and peptisase S24 domain